MPEIKADRTLDTKGLLCPMPVVKAAKEIKTLEPGQVLRIEATDRGSVADFPAWSEDTGNPLLEHYEEDGVFIFFIERGNDSP